MADSLKIKTDTLNIVKNQESQKFKLEAPVEYQAADSIRMEIKNKKAFLFHQSQLNYQDVNLKANYSEIDFNKSTLFAKGTPDSLGKMIGTPDFKQGEQQFLAEEMLYNFTSKKGLIKKVVTQEGDGYLHGDVVKKFASNESNISSGKYTTCSEKDHPHFEIRFFKAKVIPKDKIVTGPAYLVVENVPTPLIIPFGFFPNKRGRQSGILLPTYGESANRGFFLENGGYYLGLNDYMDLAIRGDIYSRGSWGFKAASVYKVRYRFSGNISLSYAYNILGEKNTPDYSKSRDFFVRWSHAQDPKARPNSRFSASVNAGTRKYNTLNPSSTDDYLSNTYQSNISYSTLIARKHNFSANFRHSQNNLTHRVDLSLPEIAFSTTRIYPFRRKVSIGGRKWYENIGLTYVMNTRNSISTTDSLLLKSRLSDFANGMQHQIPVSNSFKLFKYFSLSNNFTYNERWYLSSVNKYWDDGYIVVGGDTVKGFVKTDTLPGFITARDFSLSSSLSTRIYGMYQFKSGKVTAIRHVVSPSLTFSYHPDFAAKTWGYYKYYYDKRQNKVNRYSIFEKGIYGSPPAGKSGKISMAISNNLEMKVRQKSDTISQQKKIVLIDYLSVSAYYDIARDSLNWSPLIVSGRTNLTKNIDIRFDASWDPYAINDSTGIQINRFEWDVNHRLFRRVNTEWKLGINYNLNSNNFGKKNTGNTVPASAATPSNIHPLSPGEVDYSQAWSLNFNYTFTRINAYNQQIYGYKTSLVQTLMFNGDISLTPKWKAGITSGYDFENKDFSYTSVNFYRDLHCWEIRFNWIPMGIRKSYNMTLRVKAPILEDLKITKKKDFRDY